MSRTLAFVAFALFLTASPARAQLESRLVAPSHVVLGDRLRIHFHNGDPVVGVLTGCTADTGTIQPCSVCPPVPVPLASIKHWEVSSGTHRQWLAGGVVGGLLGLGVGALATAAAVTSSPYAFVVVDDRPIVACGLGGAALGLLIGFGIHHESWLSIPVAPPLERPAPLRGEHVRVQLSEGAPLVSARLVAEDSLVYVHGEDAAGVPIDSLERLQKSYGKVRQSRKGAVIGAVLGVLVGASVASRPENMGTVSGDPAAMAFWYGSAGAAAGALLGMNVSTDRWVDEPLARRTEVPVVDPEPVGMGLPPLVPPAPARAVRVTLATVHF